MSDAQRPLEIAVAIMGTEGFGVLSFLLNQWAHASDAHLNFRYLALNDGRCAAALREAGAPVTIVGGGAPQTFPGNPLMLPIMWLRSSGAMRAAVRGLRAELIRLQPDIVYSHSHYLHVLCGRARRGLSCRGVGQMHGLVNVARLFGLQRQFVCRVLARHLDLAITISDTTHQALAPVLRRRARRVYNGVDVKAIEAQTAGVKKTPGKLVIVGRLVPRKRQHIALHAVALLRDRGRTCTLEIIGGPLDDANPYYLELRRIAAELAITDRVRFAGVVSPPHAEVASAELAIGCDSGEPFGLVVVEAAAAGTAVVVPDRGGMSELVEHGATGWHYAADDPQALADAIDTLLDDAPLRERLVQAGRKAAIERFDIASHMRELRAAFEQVLAAG
ncbi:MAG: glycosyltransferase [Planctomycetota bacterium]|nr:MAG: glycosyltransferase [Planctomycetota bacterium]